MNDRELKRCKLCNSNAKILVVHQKEFDDFGISGPDVYWARCVNREDCGADSYYSFGSEEEATTYWNHEQELDNSPS